MGILFGRFIVSWSNVLVFILLALLAGVACGFGSYNPDVNYCGAEGRVSVPNEHYGGASFNLACYDHDGCYEFCRTTRNSQEQCDEEFNQDLDAACMSNYVVQKSDCLNSYKWYNPVRYTCLALVKADELNCFVMSDTYWLAVSLLGGGVNVPYTGWVIFSAPYPCVDGFDVETTSTTSSTTSSTIKSTTTSTLKEPLKVFDVRITSFTCTLNAVADKYGNKLDSVRATVKGTAQGPVGARVELPSIIWSDDNFDCGVWTLKSGALTTVGDTCVRGVGQPETTNWVVDTGGEEQGGWLRGKSRSFNAKIYMGSNLKPEKEDIKSTFCQ
ncbi:MAG: hypothetical protein KKD39_02015 [Candidatus Altiarchaeota archaeon]|nr:hypothetical protein [Candidatus Altiarchaeota archaeon]